MFTNVPAPPSGGGLPASLSREGIRRGTDAKWTAVNGWTDRDGLPLPQTMLVVGYTTALEKWKNKHVENITEHPLPDVEALNSAVPRSEWEINPHTKALEPPWKRVYVVYMIDIVGGSVFTFKNSTFGARMMFEQLEERIAVMQMLRSERVMPIVRLEKRTWHSTTFGPQTRPHLEPLEWRQIGGDGPKPAPQLAAPAVTPTPAEAPTPVATTAPAPTAPVATAAPASPTSTVLDHTKPVKPMTVGELIADEIPWK